MADAWNEIRKEVSCSICFDLLKEPKILPCLHTFCKRCLQVLWEKSQVLSETSPLQQTALHDTTETNAISNASHLVVGSDTIAQAEVLQKSEKRLRNVSLYKQLNNREIKCSLCPEKVMLTSVDALPTNESAQQLVELVRIEQQISGQTPPSCQSCDNELGAVAVCLQCDVFLCTACVAVHKKLKLLSAHQVVSFDYIKSGKVDLWSVLDHKREHCSVHPDKLLDLFCKNECCFICLGCAVVKHRDHRYDEISEVAKEYKVEINCTIPRIKAELEKLEKAVAEMKNIQTQVQLRKLENTQKVEETFKEILLALKEKRQQLIDDINETTASKLDALNKQCEELTNKCTLAKAYLNFVEAKLQSGRDRALVAMKPQIIERSTQLVKVVAQSKLSPVETEPNKVEFCRIQKVLGLIKLFNKPDVYVKKCKLSQLISRQQGISNFQVTLKDSHSHVVQQCADIITIKALPDENVQSISYTVQPLKIFDQGNGHYTFSISTGKSCTQGYYCRCRKIGLVYAQVVGEDIPGSPIR